MSKKILGIIVSIVMLSSFATPLKNQFQGNDIYKGDALEGYLGFREESRTSYGPDDFQFGIGLNGKNAELYRLTGDEKYLNAALPLKGQNPGFPDVSWDNTLALGVYALVKAEKNSC
jgi:hypothetical protein